MTQRMTGPDCAVMFNIINTHKYIHMHTHNIHTEYPIPFVIKLYCSTRSQDAIKPYRVKKV